MNLDVLAIGAHPDDVELGVAGIIHKLTQAGRTVAILDLTRGELGTRGSVPERLQEAEAAAQILGVTRRTNAELPDGNIADTPEQRLPVITAIRSFRPRIVLAPMLNDRHPDHGAASVLTRHANFFAGLRKIDTGQEPHRASRVYNYYPYTDFRTPELVVDVSAHFETKLEAIRAYTSQFYNPNYTAEATYIATPEFFDFIRINAAYWGRRIGVAYGEALHTESPVGVTTLPGLEGNV